MAKPPDEIIFEDDDDAESTVSDEPSNNEPETSEEDDVFEVDEPRTQALKNTIISRRGLLVAALLAGAGAVATGAVLLREKGPAGSDLMKEYVNMADPTARQMFAIKQVAAGNIPSSSTHFVTIKVKGKGKSKTTLQFEVAPHGLRIGHNDDYMEVPTDGPYSMAACEAQGLTLSNGWMGGKIREQAFATGGKVPFIDYAEIARFLRMPTALDGVKMKSPEFVQGRNFLLKKWRSEHNIDDDRLTSGYFKEVIQNPKQSAIGHVATYPGYIDPPIKKGKHEVEADEHEFTYLDYSHLGRCVKWEMKVDEKPITMGEFFCSEAYQKEFGFDAEASKTKLRPYKYSPELLKFMDENGYLRSEYDSTKEKEEREKNKKKEEDKKKKEEEKAKKK